jgi:two-component system, LuxR family, response regulator FixJ
MMADGDPQVWVVDDNEAMRDSLAMLLRSAGYKVGNCASAVEFLKRWTPGSPGCAVLDIRMPGMDGLELQQEISVRDKTLPVIFITGHGDVPMAVRAMQRGALHFLQKPFGDEELMDAIDKALGEHATHRDGERIHRDLLIRVATLTPREREVMERVVAGQANKVIAIELEVSQRTVEIHRARVMEKMGCRTLPELVRGAILLPDGGDG